MTNGFKLLLQAQQDSQTAAIIVRVVDGVGFDTDAARAVGIDLGRLLVSEPDTNRQALEVAGTLACSRSVDLVVVSGFTNPDNGDMLAVRQALESAYMAGCVLAFADASPPKKLNRASPAAPHHVRGMAIPPDPQIDLVLAMQGGPPPDGLVLALQSGDHVWEWWHVSTDAAQRREAWCLERPEGGALEMARFFRWIAP